MSRKDSKGMFAAVLGKLDDEAQAEQSQPRSSSPHLMKVAQGVRQMQERSELADRLLKNGEQIVDLDPDAITPSLIPDRFDNAYDDTAIAEIAESMRERGQIVPGLVRPIPGDASRFQIVYGRRRLAAAKQLGIKFKAAIRDLSDEEAVVFQGEENTAREDLSFIEKCLFALAQEKAGYKRETICASLSTGKSHVSEMIKISSVVPMDIFYAIGKAPGIGRGRWEEFAKRWPIGDAELKLKPVLGQAGFSQLTSDERFVALFAALPTEAIPATAKSKPEKNLSDSRIWTAKDSAVKISLKGTPKKAVIAVESKEGSQFAEFIADSLDELYTAFTASIGKSE